MLEEIRKTHPNLEITEGQYVQVGLMLSTRNGLMRPYIEFEFTSTFEKKDKTRSKPKTRRINVLHTYCPFCGKRFEKDKKAITGEEAEGS